MLMELVTNNRAILDHIEESQIDFFISLLDSKEQDSRLLDFLSALCICEGVSIPLNQTYIAKRLLVDFKDKRLVYLTDVVKKKVIVTARDGTQTEVRASVGSQRGS